MSQRRTISGRSAGLVWLSTLFVLALIAIIVVVVFLLAPNRRRQQQLEAHYKACVAFQSAGDWDKAVEACAQAVAIDGSYKDVQSRYAEVLSKQREATTTSRAVAATATANALEAHYQKGSAYMGMQRWEEAKAELGAVFEEDPNYKDVQVKLAEVETEVAKLIPTAMPILPTPEFAEIKPDYDSGWKADNRSTNHRTVSTLTMSHCTCVLRIQRFSCPSELAFVRPNTRI